MILSEKSATPAVAGASFFGIMRGGMAAAELLRQLLDLAAGAFGIDAGFLGVVELQRDVREVKHAYAFLVGKPRGRLRAGRCYPIRFVLQMFLRRPLA